MSEQRDKKKTAQEEILVNCCAVSLQFVLASEVRMMAIIKINLVETSAWELFTDGVVADRRWRLRHSSTHLTTFHRDAPPIQLHLNCTRCKISIKECKTINCIQIKSRPRAADRSRKRSSGSARRQAMNLLGTHIGTRLNVELTILDVCEWKLISIQIEINCVSELVLVSRDLLVWQCLWNDIETSMCPSSNRLHSIPVLRCGKSRSRSLSRLSSKITAKQWKPNSSHCQWHRPGGFNDE